MLRELFVWPYHIYMRWFRRPHISVVPLIICVIIIAATFLHEVVFQKPPLTQIGRNVEASGVVAEDPEFKKGYTRVQLEADYGRVYIMLRGKQSIARSEELTVSGKLEAGFGTFVAFIKEPKIISIKQPAQKDFALRIRDWFSARFRELVPDETENGLALSYLLGQKTLLTSELKDSLRLVGLSHIVVASGFHLAVVVNIAKKRFGKISRFATFAGATIMLVSYVSITGFTPSMMRAGLATFLALWAWYYGRRFHPARLILYVMALSLLLNSSNINNLAWQLSFASYTGIIFLTPLITKTLYGDKKPGYFASIIIASIAAQSLCLPIAIYNYGSIPGLAIVANLLISPLIAPTMLLTFLTGLTALPPLAWATSLLLKIQIAVVKYLSSISWASTEIGKYDVRVFLVLPVIIIAAIVMFKATHHSYRPAYALEKSRKNGKI